MKKSLNEELIEALESKVEIMQSIIDSQNKGLELSVQIMDTNDKRIDIKDKIIAILQKQNETLLKENLRLNIAIGIFLLSSIIFCIVKMATL